MNGSATYPGVPLWLQKTWNGIADLLGTRRPFPPLQPPKSDHTRIALLEHELFGVEPKRGSSAAFLIAQRRAFATCRHDSILETTTLGSARRTGVCATCPERFVEDDDGNWHQP